MANWVLWGHAEVIWGVHVVTKEALKVRSGTSYVGQDSFVSLKLSFATRCSRLPGSIFDILLLLVCVYTRFHSISEGCPVVFY